MEIEHIVRTSKEECDDLYMMAIKVAIASYPSVEEQNAAILAEAPMFKAKLDELVKQAYSLGKKMKKSDKLDKTMYGADVPVSTPFPIVV